MRITIGLFALLAICVGCASGGAPGTTPPPRGTSNLITSAEVESAAPDLMNAFELVSRLRPSMMRARYRSGGNASAPVAYLDDVQLGDLDLMRTVSRALVREVRFIGPTDAIRRWGTGHSQGVIQIISKPRQP